MGTLLRVGVRHRISKFLFEWTPVNSVRPLHISKLLSSEKPSSSEDSTTDSRGVSSAVDKRFFEDLNKFQNDNKISLPQSPVKSEDFVLGPQDDPNVFGTLLPKNPYVENLKEGSEEDQLEDEYLSELPNYLPQKEYANQIKKLLGQRRFADALDVLQVTMIKKDRVKPSYYIYSILISYCGQTGYSKMAFKLYNDMKRRGLNVPSSVYTSLFNSYANSPFPLDGLKRTSHLFSLMMEKGTPPNEITCCAIIKAFSKCGSIENAFKVVDYMMDRKMRITQDIMNNLMVACKTDRTAGFRHALLVFRKGLQYRISPDIYHFNMLLSCVRNCGVGDIDSTVDMLKRLGVENATNLSSKEFKVPQLSAERGYAWEEDENISAEVVTGVQKKSLTQLPTASEQNSSASLRPNLLSRQPTLGSIVSLTDLTTCYDRLFLLGGVEGFLAEMSNHNAKPDFRTATLLLECSPESNVAEKHLLKILDKYGVTLDLLFFNTLILRRIRRQDYSDAKDALTLITSHGLEPNLQTYTNLAMTCRTIRDAYELLQALDASGLRPGIEFVTAMFGCAVVHNDMKYVNLVLDTIQYEEMAVNKVFLSKIESFYHKCKNILQIRPAKFTSRTLDAMNHFCKQYPKWRAEIQVETESHPWQQFKEKYPSATVTDKAFLEEHVEPHAEKHKFPRLGPNAGPILRKAKLKKLRNENPEHFQGKNASKKSLNRLQGFETIKHDSANN